MNSTPCLCSSKPDRCDLFSHRSENSKANMSDKGTVSPKEKEATEKRGRGRPRKLPEVKSSDVSSGDFYGMCMCLKLSQSGVCRRAAAPEAHLDQTCVCVCVM